MHNELSAGCYLSVSVQLHTSLLFPLFCLSLSLSPPQFHSKNCFQARSLQIPSKVVFQDSSSLIDSSVLFPSLSAFPLLKVSDFAPFAHLSSFFLSFLASIRTSPSPASSTSSFFLHPLSQCFRPLSLSSIFFPQSFLLCSCHDLRVFFPFVFCIHCLPCSSWSTLSFCEFTVFHFVPPGPVPSLTSFDGCMVKQWTLVLLKKLRPPSVHMFEPDGLSCLG